MLPLSTVRSSSAILLLDRVLTIFCNSFAPLMSRCSTGSASPLPPLSLSAARSDGLISPRSTPEADELEPVMNHLTAVTFRASTSSTSCEPARSTDLVVLSSQPPVLPECVPFSLPLLPWLEVRTLTLRSRRGARLGDRPRLVLFAPPTDPRLGPAQRHDPRGPALRPHVVRPVGRERSSSPLAGRRHGARRPGRHAVQLLEDVHALRRDRAGRCASALYFSCTHRERR